MEFFARIAVAAIAIFGLAFLSACATSTVPTTSESIRLNTVTPVDRVTELPGHPIRLRPSGTHIVEIAYDQAGQTPFKFVGTMTSEPVFGSDRVRTSFRIDRIIVRIRGVNRILQLGGIDWYGLEQEADGQYFVANIRPAESFPKTSPVSGLSDEIWRKFVSDAFNAKNILFQLMREALVRPVYPPTPLRVGQTVSPQNSDGVKQRVRRAVLFAARSWAVLYPEHHAEIQRLIPELERGRSSVGTKLSEFEREIAQAFTSFSFASRVSVRGMSQIGANTLIKISGPGELTFGERVVTVNSELYVSPADGAARYAKIVVSEPSKGDTLTAELLVHSP